MIPAWIIEELKKAEEADKQAATVPLYLPIDTEDAPIKEKPMEILITCD